MKSEHIGENFNKLKGLLLSHQYLRFVQKKNYLIDSISLVFILFYLFKTKTLKPCSNVIHLIYLFA